MSARKAIEVPANQIDAELRQIAEAMAEEMLDETIGEIVARKRQEQGIH